MMVVLYFRHFGEEIIAKHFDLKQASETVSCLYLKLYKEFIEGIDGIDNGVSAYPPDIKPAYRVRTDLSSRIGWLNPAWNEPSDRESVDKRFADASSLAGNEFLGLLDYYGKAWLPARDIVNSALQRRFDVVESGRIMMFDQFAPWKEHLFDLEEEQKIATDSHPYYVIYPDESGNWRIQAVPINSQSFVNRKGLPESWRGLRDDNLSRESGISNCIFAHASGFIGGNKTRDGALKMARVALQS